MPPSDPRYTSMTDDEIYFDYLTIQCAVTVADDELENEAQEEVAPPVIPEFKAEGTGSPNKQRQLAFTSDEAEFRKWYEEEIGPWTLNAN